MENPLRTEAGAFRLLLYVIAVAAGMIGDPDPYDAAMNAVQFFHISEIVISTLPRDQSKWMADKLVERVRNATNKRVEHVESSPEPVEA